MILNLTLATMPHIIRHTEEIEEHGFCQQRPSLQTGDKYLIEVDGEKRLRIVLSVELDKYVWDNVAQWTTTLMEFGEGEYKIKELPINIGHPSHTDIPVFIANNLIGVLTCDKDKVQGELFIPFHIGICEIRGVAPFGFYDCKHLEKVIVDSPVVIAYEYAFGKSGITDMVFNEEVPTMLHTTAIDGCDNLPKFNKIFDRPFSGKYLFRGGDAFCEWEEKLYELHYLNRHENHQK